MLPPDRIPKLGVDANGQRTIRHHVIKTRYGWHAATIHGIGILERGLFAWTRRGIERKTDRLARRLRAQDSAPSYHKPA
jgi:hypothetical protein